jgi:hypothetical protein
MPAGDYINVAPADLVAHSSAVEGIAGEVATAGRTADRYETTDQQGAAAHNRIRDAL